MPAKKRGRRAAGVTSQGEPARKGSVARVARKCSEASAAQRREVRVVTQVEVGVEAAERRRHGVEAGPRRIAQDLRDEVGVGGLRRRGVEVSPAAHAGPGVQRLEDPGVVLHGQRQHCVEHHAAPGVVALAVDLHHVLEARVRQHVVPQHVQEGRDVRALVGRLHQRHAWPRRVEEGSVVRDEDVVLDREPPRVGEEYGQLCGPAGVQHHGHAARRSAAAPAAPPLLFVDALREVGLVADAAFAAAKSEAARDIAERRGQSCADFIALSDQSRRRRRRRRSSRGIRVAVPLVMWSDWRGEVAVLQEMLTDRRCTALRNIGHGTDPLLVCSCRSAKGELCLAYFTQETKVGVKTLRAVRSECKAAGGAHLILVAPEGLTHFASRELAVEDGLHVEIFRKDELSFNVTKHRLVPPHRLLSAAERRQVLASLGCKPSALPKLRASDPVARYYGWPAGSVVRIDRSVGTLEPEAVFRAVV